MTLDYGGKGPGFLQPCTHPAVMGHRAQIIALCPFILTYWCLIFVFAVEVEGEKCVD